MIYAKPSTSFEAVIDTGETGLVGTIGLLIVDNDGGTTQAFSSVGIIETPIGSGVYAANRTSPATTGEYTLVWTSGAGGETLGVESLTVSASGVPAFVPLTLDGSHGLCESWTDGVQVADCCELPDGTDLADADVAAIHASLLLFELSGRRFNGVCEATVRPCAEQTSCFVPGWPSAGSPLSRASVPSRATGRGCGCQPLSYVRLAGYPVRGIVEVLIDDAVIDPAEYRLDRSRELVALGTRKWPRCQDLTVDSGEDTFFVTYEYGQDPPPGADLAAAQLACQIVRACPTSTGEIGECDLPAGTVRVTRQGMTIDTQALGLWLLGSLRTGMPLVDAFLSVYSKPRTRRTALAVPEADPWPLRVSASGT